MRRQAPSYAGVAWRSHEKTSRSRNQRRQLTPMKLSAGYEGRSEAVARQATVAPTRRSSVERRYGAPGRCQSACGPMKAAKVSVKRLGPTVPAIPVRLAMAP